MATEQALGRRDRCLLHRLLVETREGHHPDRMGPLWLAYAAQPSTYSLDLVAQ
jgi:hypothetical protein